MIFKIELCPEENLELVHPLSLGHISICNEDKLLTSKNRTPDQSMMIFLSIPLLLDDISRYFQGERHQIVHFVGTDSSFQFYLQRSKFKVKVFEQKMRLFIEADLEIFLNQVLSGTKSFILTNLHSLDRKSETHGVFNDLEDSLHRYTKFMETLFGKQEDEWITRITRD